MKALYLDFRIKSEKIENEQKYLNFNMELAIFNKLENL